MKQSATAMAGLTVLVGLMLAQPGQSQDKTVSDGVFTAAQARFGSDGV